MAAVRASGLVKRFETTSTPSTATVFGRPLGATESVCLAEVAGFVEEPTFYRYLSGRVNLELFAELDGGGAADRVDEVLGQVGLAGRGGDRVSGYSTGMRQRLGIAAALLRSPRTSRTCATRSPCCATGE